MREVPDVFDLVKFIRKKAVITGKEQKHTPTQKPEQKKGGKHQPSKQRGSVHVANPQQQPPPYQAPQPAPVQSAPPPQRGRGAQQRQRSAYPQCRYVCPLCGDNHYAFACSKFESFTVAQRKEHVRVNSLCCNCLKAGHSAANCRSEYSCRRCSGRHNTLLHVDTPTPAAQPTQGTANVVAPAVAPPLKSSLIMTSKVLLTGPTGKTMVVRVLLDSGSCLSIISTKAMKTLALPKLDTSVIISGIESAADTPARPMVNVSLSSLYRKDWNQQVTAAVIPQVTGDLPLQGASSVRKLPHIVGLHLADAHFDEPGRIDLLLGEDVLPEIFLPGEVAGPPGTARAWNTVFGWALRGAYTPDKPGARKAPVYVAASSSDQSTNDALSKFWELEEPSKPDIIMTSEERKVQSHHDLTHSYVNAAGKYMVSLPRKEVNLTLGESRNQALTRYKSNERSLLNKGTLDKFQAVLQEYLDLGHARLVSTTELSTPTLECYYLPTHGVTKESSSTTKLRVVFDASAKTSTGTSLNDLLAIGPTLHPTLDKILIKFRTYRVAVSGDITKMYREVLLSPPDRQLHRFLWRPHPDQPIRDYCMDGHLWCSSIPILGSEDTPTVS